MIAITQQQKEEWEAKIAELYRESTKQELINKNYSSICTHKAFLYEELLSKAIVLPVEESFYTVENKIKKHQGNTGCSKDGGLIKEYGNGVIIKPQ